MNEEWEKNPKGWPLYAFIPDVGKRMVMEWLLPGKTMTWFMIGYSPFDAYFERFRIKTDEGVCICGDVSSDPQYLLYSSP